MVDQSRSTSTPSPAWVALAAWVVPGAGYLLLGQRARGLTIGITVLVMFFLGLLIGGVRALDVPGYNAHGARIYFYYEDIAARGVRVARTSTELPPSDAIDPGWILTKRPLDEIRAKPWSIAQIMMGPIDLLCDWWSIAVSQPTAGAPVASDSGDEDNGSSSSSAALSGAPIGARSHARINELGVLYTAIAGMLNLLAIIDSSHRAGHPEAA